MHRPSRGFGSTFFLVRRRMFRRASSNFLMYGTAPTIAADSENGWVAVNQVVKWNANYVETHNGNAVSGSGGTSPPANDEWKADGCIFSYNGGNPYHAISGRYRAAHFDSPSLRLPASPADSAHYKLDAVSTYLYKPGGAETIWVPIFGAEWGFDASAHDPSGNGSSWQIAGLDNLYANWKTAFPEHTGIFGGDSQPRQLCYRLQLAVRGTDFLRSTPIMTISMKVPGWKWALMLLAAPIGGASSVAAQITIGEKSSGITPDKGATGDWRTGLQRTRHPPKHRDPPIHVSDRGTD